MAEYFRDVQKQDVLFFIDNIFRFTQAGFRGLHPARPHAVRRGLPAQPGGRDGPAPGAHHLDPWSLDHPPCRRSTSPADDLTDPAPATTFAHLDATTVLSRRSRRRASTRRSTRWTRRPGSWTRAYIAQDHYDCAMRVKGHPAEVQGPPGHHRDPRHRRTGRGGQAHRPPGPPYRALPVAEHPRGEAVHRCRRLGCHPRGVDHRVQRHRGRKVRPLLHEQAFFLCGGIEDLERNAKELGVG